MAKTKDASAKAPEFPKPLVRLTPSLGGYDAEVRMVADAEGETAAKAEGFEVVAVPATSAAFVEYPKWQYHADGRRQVVQNAAEADALDGFEDTPPAPPAADVMEGDLPRGKRAPADRG